MSAKIRNITLLSLLLGATLFLSFNRHSKAGIQNYHSEIWADKAGYYVYLPALFIYQFSGDQLPDNIDIKTGNGFVVNDGIILTKYPYGVALMQSPFFLIGHILADPLGYEKDGFSLIYHKNINIAGVVYAFFASILLFFFLHSYVNRKTAFFTVLCLFLGTNIFYYAIFETGMSHIYALFLFSAFLYLSPSLIRSDTSRSRLLLIGFVIGLILVVRPLNVIFLPVFFLLNNIRWKEMQGLTRRIGWLLIPVTLLVIPQLLYWKYSSGHFFHYSYQGEGFTNLCTPKLLNLWFSTNNGLFIYNPLIFLILLGLFYFYRVDPFKARMIALYFILISLVFASWHDWSYGCSYGSRPFVEYYAVLSLPFAFVIKKIDKNRGKNFGLIIAIIIAISYNQKLMFSYDGCWYGHTWDFAEWWRLLIGPTK